MRFGGDRVIWCLTTFSTDPRDVITPFDSCSTVTLITQEDVEA